MSKGRDLLFLHSGLRLRYYLHASGHALLRHWQWLLLLSLVVPGMPVASLLSAPGGLLAAAFAGAAGATSRATVVAAVLIIGAVWTWLQRRSIRGGALAEYSSVLAISAFTVRAVDIVVLLIADLPLLLIFIAAAIETQGGSRVPVLGPLLAMLATQLGVLRRSLLISFGGVASGLILVIGPQFAVVPILAALATLAVPVNPAVRRRTHSRSRVFDRLNISPSLRVQLQILAANRAGTLLRLIAAAGLAIAADELSILLSFDGRTLPLAIVALAIIAMLLGGLYRTLDVAQQSMRSLTASLPIARDFWARRDLLLVSALALAPFAIILAWLPFNGVVAPPAAALLLAASFGLLIALRPAALSGRRLGTLFGVLLAALWTSLAIAATIR